MNIKALFLDFYSKGCNSNRGRWSLPLLNALLFLVHKLKIPCQPFNNPSFIHDLHNFEKVRCISAASQGNS